jgi:hypothetical protein
VVARWGHWSKPCCLYCIQDDLRTGRNLLCIEGTAFKPHLVSGVLLVFLGVDDVHSCLSGGSPSSRWDRIHRGLVGHAEDIVHQAGTRQALGEQQQAVPRCVKVTDGGLATVAAGLIELAGRGVSRRVRCLYEHQATTAGQHLRFDLGQ